MSAIITGVLFVLGSSAARAQAVWPRDLTFPYVVSPACPGEGCSFGTWLACEETPVYASIGDSAAATGQISANARFEVVTGAMVTLRPGVVEITKPVVLESYDEAEKAAGVGDTLFVFDYEGEGYYRIRYDGEFRMTLGFWPNWRFYPGTGYEYSGKVLQEPDTAFWIQVRQENGALGWVPTSGAELSSPSLIERDFPLRCAG